MNFKKIWDFVQEVIAEWSKDNASRLAAALAYYTIFSLAPLLIIAIAVAGFFFGEAAAQEAVVTQLESLIGQQGAEAVQQMLANANRPGAGTVALIIGVATLILGASGVFAQLKSALNTIWDVKPVPGQGIWKTVTDRLLSFGMVLGIAFLLLVSLLVSTVLSTVSGQFEQLLPGSDFLWQLLDFVISLGVIALLFAIIYKVLPDVTIAWKDVWVGAGVTALLFTIGKFLIGLYLGRSSVESAYGAAGSLVVLLVWVYYSAQIVFIGAEFTQVYARRYGSRIRPEEDAVALPDVGKDGQETGGVSSGLLPVARAESTRLQVPEPVVRQPVDAALLEETGKRYAALAGAVGGLALFAALVGSLVGNRSRR
ncbi:MAG: YihY/virulence factor BrkB family protein [Anaerolineales bacterium]